MSGGHKGARHLLPLSDFKLVSAADPSAAQDSSQSTQINYDGAHAMEEDADPPAQLWQQEVLHRSRSLQAAHAQAHHHHHHHHHLPRRSHGGGQSHHTARISESAEPAYGRTSSASDGPATGVVVDSGMLMSVLDALVLGKAPTMQQLEALRTTLEANSPPGTNSLLRTPSVRREPQAPLAGTKRPSQSCDEEQAAPAAVSRGAVVSCQGYFRNVWEDAPLVASMLHGVNQWQWDAFAFSGACSGRPLTTLSLHLLKHSGLVAHFQLSLPKLSCWLAQVEAGYEANPYHNAVHAADVLQKVHMILTEGGLLAALGGDPLVLLAGYLAAVVHDYAHKGVTNEFLINTEHELALLYNDTRPHENHHVSAPWRMARCKFMDFLSDLPREQRARLRALLIAMVLGTDMKQHFALTAGFVQVVAQVAAGTTTLWQHSELVLQMAIKAADLGHLTSAWPVHQRWVSCLEEEFFLQGDRERALGLTVSPMMDRAAPGISATQAGFFDVVALPLFKGIVKVLPGCHPLLATVQQNKACWEQVAASHAAAAAASTVAVAAAAAAPAAAACSGPAGAHSLPLAAPVVVQPDAGAAAAAAAAAAAGAAANSPQTGGAGAAGPAGMAPFRSGGLRRSTCHGP